MRRPISSYSEDQGDEHSEVEPIQGRQNAMCAGHVGEGGEGQGEPGHGSLWKPYRRGWGRLGGRPTSLCPRMRGGGIYIALQRRGYLS